MASTSSSRSEPAWKRVNREKRVLELVRQALHLESVLQKDVMRNVGIVEVKPEGQQFVEQVLLSMVEDRQRRQRVRR